MAHEDDAQRAVRVALECVNADSIQRLTAAAGLRGGLAAGIHTGPVVVAAPDDTTENTQAAHGGTPSYAICLLANAEAGAVLTSKVTQSLIEEYFEYRRLKLNPTSLLPAGTPVYQVLALDAQRSRFDDPSGSRLTPLTGRDMEVALLQQRWQQASKGMGQVVMLSGEAGIGKSRLAFALRQEAAKTPHIFMIGRCTPYHQNSALHPIIELTRQILELMDEASAATPIALLEGLLEHLDLPKDETVPLLASLLSLTLPEGRYAPLTLPPQRQKQRTLEAVLTLILELSTRDLLLLIVEDLHWADPSTLEFLSLLVDQTPTMRLCLLCTYRPTFQTPWSARAHISFLTLTRLPELYIDRMLESITAGKSLPPQVRKHIESKTDGVPLFVEELTKMILETGLLRAGAEGYELTGSLPSLAIPTTLHDSLRARLDHLNTAKRVAQIGAVLGRTFSFKLLQAVAAMDEAALRRELERLVANYSINGTYRPMRLTPSNTR